jgi:hypothetical protein
MNMHPVPVVGMVPRWAPPAYAPRLAQAAAPAPGPAPVVVQPEKHSLADIDGPLFAFLTDAAAASSTAILGYIFGEARSRWSTVFWIASGVSAFKGIVDLSRLR